MVKPYMPMMGVPQGQGPALPQNIGVTDWAIDETDWRNQQVTPGLGNDMVITPEQANAPAVAAQGALPPPVGSGGFKMPFDLEVASPFDEDRPDHNKRLGAFMGFLKMIEAGGTPGGSSTLARIAQGAQTGAQTYLALEKQDEDAELKKIIAEAKLAAANKKAYKLHVGGDGTVYRYDPSDPNMKMIKMEGAEGKVQAGEFERMLSASGYTKEEQDKLRREYLQTKAAGKGGTTVSVSMDDSKAWQTVQAKYYDESRNQSDGANNLLSTVDKMRGALTRVQTGATKPILHPLNAVAKDLGIDLNAVAKAIGIDLNTVAGEEDVLRYTRALSLAMGKELLKGQGSVTNEERKMVETLAAKLGNDPASNKAALDDIENWATTRIEKFDTMSKYLEDPANNKSLWGFDTLWNSTLAAKRAARKSALPGGGGGRGSQPSDLSDAEMQSIIQQLGPERAAQIFGQ